MILEMVGSRVLSPYVGTSIIVWTSLIGIILGSLSLGYYLGGKIADIKASNKILSLLLFASALLIALTALIKTPVLSYIGTTFADIRTASIISTIILFAPASIILGMISPYTIKLKLKNLNATGRIVGNLYAISTIGSIIGTFLAGFYLIALFGDTALLLILALTLSITSLLALTKKDVKLALAIIIITIISVIGFVLSKDKNSNIIEIDTTYNHIKIYDTVNLSTGENIKMLQIGNGYHSAMSLENDELVFEYTKYYRLIDHFIPDLKSALMIGGGAYSYPQDFLKNHANATLDVVEIDPELTKIAKKYFNLKEDDRLKIYHEDGRTFLNKTKNSYDAILIDAFLSSLAVPHHLTTIENINNIYNSLNENGVVIANLISSIEEDSGKFLRAEYYTYKEIFPQVYVFPVQYPEAGEFTQNVILIALKSENPISLTSENKELNKYLSHIYKKEIANDMPLLTDDFSPVDQYTMNLL